MPLAPEVSNGTSGTSPLPLPACNERQPFVTVLAGGFVDWADAARGIGIAPKTLSNWQALKVGPRPRLVHGRVRYVWAEVLAFGAGEAVSNG